MEQPMQSLRPMVPPPPLVGDPPSMYASGLHASVSDIHGLLDAWADFLASFTPQFITDGAGKRWEVLARTRYKGKQEPGTEWFAVSDISSDGTFKVKVNEGRVLCPDITGHDSSVPSITKYLRSITAAEKELAVANGSLIYCKITASKDPAGYIASGEDTAGIVAVTVNMKSFTWRASAAEIIVAATEQAGSATVAYVLLAEIKITDDVLKIIPRHSGIITAPAFTATYQEDPTVVTETETYSVCASGTAVTATFIAVQT